MSLPEEWRPVVGYERLEVSNRGRVRDSQTGRLRKNTIRAEDDGGYAVAKVGDRTTFVHKLVLEAFVGPRPHPDWYCRHLNGTPTDNRVENLAWGTASQNQFDRVAHGRHHNANKTACKRGHPFSPENTNKVWDKRTGNYTRVCRTCLAVRLRRYAQQAA